MRAFDKWRPSFKLLPYILSGYRCGAPKTVDLEITNRCNLRCHSCWFYGERGIGDKYSDLELSTIEVFRLIDQFSEYKPNVYLGGSEPFIRQDLLEILAYIKSHALTITLTTNGTLLDPGKIEALVAVGIDHILFSIYGREELTEHETGDGDFVNAISVVKELLECKRRRGSAKPHVSVNVVVRAGFAHRLEEVMDAFKGATEDEVTYRIHHLWYITHKELSVHQAATRQWLGCMAPGAESHLLPGSQAIDPASLADTISSFTDRSQVRSFPNLNHHEIVKYYSEDGCIKERCIAPFFIAVVKPNGDVKFCPDEWIDDFILGNVRNDTFDHIWNGDKARKFRAVLLKQKQFAGCKRCSWMYSF